MTNSQKEAGVTAASFSDKGEMRNDGIFTGNKLESTVDIVKDRCSCNDNCLFSGNFLCKKDHETQTRFQSGPGWDPHDAAGSSTDSCRLLSPFDLQPQTLIR